MELNFPEIERKILNFWAKKRIFEKLRKKIKGGKRFSFLDGPITANNPMGVHHAWGRTLKDLFQRYKAMQGFDQRFQNGFDCQGLWVEVEVEKELGFKTKKDIEKYGIDKFVKKCKERVLKYSKIQTEQSIRLGQWQDWKNSYYTMSDENNYAIWGFLKKCWKKGYLYKGRDSIPWCPRCGTAISQHEILTEEYKEVSHESVYFRLPVVGSKNENLLLWTTTPWTLPANIAAAVDKDLDYSLVQDYQGLRNWVAKDLAKKVFGEGAKVVKTVKGKDLAGLKYSFVFDDLPRVKKAAENSPDKFHSVVLTDSHLLPITTEQGTGLVHVAVSAGQEDFQLGKKLNLPMVEIIDEDATYLDGLGEFSGKNAKKEPKVILDFLASKEGTIFKVESYKHRYPTCWRCKEELVWRVVDEWYISMQKLRTILMETAKKINWIPSFGLERELDWLKNMQDWLISKKRYWGLALPIFECACGNFEVIGSKKELKQRAVKGWEKFKGHSPHRPWVDKVKIQCKKCGQPVSRVKDVGNPWLDAGIVPFSTLKYFSNKKYWEKWFPAELICESFPGQFKNWFYSLLVMSQVLENTNPVRTIFGYASVRDEKGEEMHKSKGNAIWFDEAVEKLGADPLRWHYAKHNPENNLLFGWKALQETKRTLMTLQNCFVFFFTYVEKGKIKEQSSKLPPKSKNLLDLWIVSRLNGLIGKVAENLDEYNVSFTASSIEKFFVDDLSLWYIRRSRKRFHETNAREDRKMAAATLEYLLLNLLKLTAPIIPFLTEEIYQGLRLKRRRESVHFYDFPEANKKLVNLKLEEKMLKVREVVTQALAERGKAKIKVRQPLNELRITDYGLRNEKGLLELIKEEVNVKKITFGKKLKLQKEITRQLKEEGLMREIIRNTQEMRKKAGLTPKDKIEVRYFGTPALSKILERNKKVFLRETFSEKLNFWEDKKESLIAEKALEVDHMKLWLGIKKC
ncbi:MAG: isoleucyl-tRNA synthetase [Parcubacteria group bacterium Gr01-1014_30]|nr:MAG: isoleucyl-tRNA synthetase [Parcubacteria group bacterium Gr01-1014_30]